MQYLDQDGNAAFLEVLPGRPLFILGPNGSGKSSLILYLYKNAKDISKELVIAHRMLWMNGPGLEITTNAAIRGESDVRSFNHNSDSRYRDHNPSYRQQVALHRLISAEQDRALRFTEQSEEGKNPQLERGFFSKINSIFSQSGVDIHLRLNAGMLEASKGLFRYGVDELSDGEKNILILCSQVLTSKPGTIVFIDEPERHLHPRISRAALGHLFNLRPDIRFVVATHDIESVAANIACQVVLIRNYIAKDDQSHPRWDLQVLNDPQAIDESVRSDILGARQKILFVESDNPSSIDARLYTLLFPGVSVVPKGNCTNVKNAVNSVRSLDAHHRLKAGGIVDKDSQREDDVQKNKLSDIHSLPFYSIESVYFHPELVRPALKIFAAPFGWDVEELSTKVDVALLEAFDKRKDVLARKKAFTVGKMRADQSLPLEKDINSDTEVSFSIPFGAIFEEERDRISKLVAQRDIVSLIEHYPVKKAGCQAAIMNVLGVTDIGMYYTSAISALAQDGALRDKLRVLIGDFTF